MSSTLGEGARAVAVLDSVEQRRRTVGATRVLCRLPPEAAVENTGVGEQPLCAAQSGMTASSISRSPVTPRELVPRQTGWSHPPCRGTRLSAPGACRDIVRQTSGQSARADSRHPPPGAIAAIRLDRLQASLTDIIAPLRCPSRRSVPHRRRARYEFINHVVDE